MNSLIRNCSGRKREEKHTGKKNKDTKRTLEQEKLFQMIQNIRATDDTPMVYDNAFKTMTIRTPRFNIPLINEMFHTTYSFEDKVELVCNEDTGVYRNLRIKNRRTDSKLRVEEKRYHLECESNPNGEIAIRLFEYDWMDAVENLFQQKDTSQEKDTYVIRLQNSGLLYLRSNGETPKEFNYRLILPGGVETVYQVPVIRNLNYTLDEIFEKKLYMLLPYYFIRYEKLFDETAKTGYDKQSGMEPDDTVALDKKLANQLESDMTMLYNELNQRVRTGELVGYEMELLCQLICNVNIQVFRNRPIMVERMGKIMGGQVLEFDWDIEYRRQMSVAEEKGLEKGLEHKLLSQICRKLQKGKTIDVIADELEEEPERIGQICEVARHFAPEYDVEKIYDELHAVSTVG